jgi:hypothetical protein
VDSVEVVLHQEVALIVGEEGEAIPEGVEVITRRRGEAVPTMRVPTLTKLRLEIRMERYESLEEPSMIWVDRLSSWVNQPAT